MGELQRFIVKPSADMYAGVRVTKETEFEYETDHVKQTLKNLVLHSVTTKRGENFTACYDTTIQLSEGDILLLVEEERGYIKPTLDMVTVNEAIEELSCIKDLV